ncbi:uncharacterized protein TNCV_4532331 [Trichonephila clavipes]|nr:uncharacterized protein TNCV_4532331 [Trichonephila clavipes]
MYNALDIKEHLYHDLPFRASDLDEISARPWISQLILLFALSLEASSYAYRLKNLFDVLSRVESLRASGSSVIFDTFPAFSETSMPLTVSKSLKMGEQMSMTKNVQASVITDDLMQAVEAKIRENRRFTITTLSLEFPDVSRSVVYKIGILDLNFKKLFFRWVPRLLTVKNKENRFAISLDF